MRVDLAAGLQRLDGGGLGFDDAAGLELVGRDVAQDDGQNEF